MRMRSLTNCRQQQQPEPSALSFQDGGPPRFNLKLDGEASNSRRPGKPAKGSRYLKSYLDSHSAHVKTKLD